MYKELNEICENLLFHLLFYPLFFLISIINYLTVINIRFLIGFREY